MSSGMRVILPWEVDFTLLGHVDDVLLGAQFVLWAAEVLQVDVVLVEEGFHPRSLVGREADAERRKYIRDDLQTTGVKIQL